MVSRARLLAASATFFCTGLFVGCTVSAGSPAVGMVVGGLGGTGVLGCYWWLQLLNDRERRQSTSNRGSDG